MKKIASKIDEEGGHNAFSEANRLSVSERGILYKRKTGFYTFDELIKLFSYLEFTDEEIASVFRV